MRKLTALIVLLVLFGVVWYFPGSRRTTEPNEASTSNSQPAETLAGTPKAPSDHAGDTGTSAPSISGAANSMGGTGAPNAAATQPSGGAADSGISESALKQIQALQEEKKNRSAVQNKIDSQLLFAAKMSRNEPIAEGVPTLRVELDRDADGRVLVDIKADVTKALLEEITNRGGVVINSFAQYQAIRAALPLERIESLGERNEVVFISPAARAERHTGSVNSEGDIAENAQSARATFGVDGTGVKVAVLSDSVDFLAQSQGSGDLGQVIVLAGQSGVPGSGEGTAMLEIVHDLAPGAQLFYATAFGGQASFASNIRQLRAAGCDIIIDDVSYYDESPFQDAIIAQAVNDVTASGALYFSSAGNSGNKNDAQSGVWEGDFVDGGGVSAPITGGGRLHSFGGVNYNTVLAGGSSRRVDLFWADPLAHASDDYDVYILDPTGATVVGGSNNTQNGTQDPYEAMNKVDPDQRLVVVRYSGQSRYLNLSTGRGRLAISTAGQVRGHSCASDAYCVAAVPAANATGPFTAAAKVETFSSDGLRRVFFNADGSAITAGNFSSTGGSVRQKPDIAAADGVKTTLPPDSGLNPFYGTSAAAPHAGAIAALLKSYRPNLTPAEMRTALTSGTLDIEAAGVDRDSGQGLVMADLVLQSVTVVQPPTITGFTPAAGPVGTVVTVSGTKFNGVTSVKFNGVVAAFSVISGTQLTATVPAGASTAAISVTTPDGSASSATAFVVTAAPSITSIVPNSGDIGTVVVITGATLTGATDVSFNGVPAIVFAVNSSTQITATVPAGATTGKISITAPGGTVQSAGAFTVTALPVVTGFTPTGGPIGSSVTISGANFVNVSAVRFNGVAAVSPTVNSPTQITATVPSGASSGPIVVATAAGSGTSAGPFTVVPAPTITGFSPASGPAGTAVNITGTGLDGATAVTFNGLNADTFLVVSATQITAATPAGVSAGPIRVATPGGTAISPGSFTPLGAPANDNFVAAQNLTGNAGTVNGNTQGATQEPNEPNHAGNPGGKSIWYRWTAPASGTWAFDTVGSSFDTLLAVYTGTALNNLTVVAYNDDIVDTVITNSRLAFVATGGTAYYVAVDGFSSGGQNATTASGSVSLNWGPTATIPAITSFSPLSGGVGTSVTVNGANFTGVTNVAFNGTSAGFSVNSATRITATVPTGASTGPIRVATASGATLSASSFTVTSVANNDNFANAFILASSGGRTNCSSSSATKEPGEPAHAGNTGGKSVWFSWTAPANGLWTFDTQGSSFDTLLAVYTGGSVGALVSVASNDDSNGQQTSQVAFNTTAGTAYRIAVDGYAGAGGDVVLNWTSSATAPVVTTFAPPSGGPGTPVVITGLNLAGTIGVKFNGVAAAAVTVNSGTQLTATVPAGSSTGPVSVTTSNGVAQSATAFVVTGPRPSNDSFAARIALTGAVNTVTGSNAGASRETGEPNHAGNPGGSSVWWSWTAPSNGTYAVSTRGSDFDTILGVYSGTTLAALTPVGSNDDGPNMDTASLVTFTASAGASYQIAVDGYNGATGNIVLSVFPYVAPQAIYFTGFERPEGYNTNLALAGQKGWQIQGAGEAGLLYNAFQDLGQQAYLGFSSTVNGDNTWVWQPLNYSPDTNSRPVVKFSVSMEIVDSSDGLYDDFGWDLFNRDNKQLFLLEFDNSNLGIYYQLNDGSGTYHYTGQDFRNGQVYLLEVTMDFGRNLWSATLDGTSLVSAQPISATNNVALDLGDIDAFWFQTSGTFGDNFMLFDNYSVTATKSQLPLIIAAPQSQSVVTAGTASFLVVVDSPLAVTYQWQLDGTDITGATGARLDLSNVGPGQQGSYTVTVSNSEGQVTSAPAVLTVSQLPNLAPYQPTGWSDKIVVASVASTNAPNPVITEGQNVFVSWAVLNAAGGHSISSRFYTQMYLDGALKFTWYTDQLDAGFYTFVVGYDLGQLTAGTHTLRIDTDATSVIGESDETDNSYSNTFSVSSGSNPPPQLGAPSRGANGVFQFTLTGIPSRTYEIGASTNFTTWDTIATLVNTNANGILQVADPGSTNLPRRYYRGRLIVP